MNIKLMLPVMVLCVSLSIGCTKKENPSLPYSNVTLMDGKGYSISIANPNNPYDFVGCMHNQILDYVIGNASLEYMDDGIINCLTDEFMNSVYDDYSGQMSQTEFTTFIASVDTFVSDFTKGKATYGTVISDSYLSTALNEVSNMLIGMINASLIPPTEFAQYVITYENQILEQNEYSSPDDSTINEQAQALAALSIARYSYCYWYEVVHNSNSPWYFYQSNTKECPIPEVGRCIRDVAVTAAADVRGFFGKVESPANPSNPAQGGLRISISLSRAGKASSRKWKSQKDI